VTGALAVVVLLVQLWLLPAIPPARAIGARDLLTPLTRRMAQVGLLAVLFFIAGHFAAYTYLKPLLQQVFGLAANAVSTLLLVYGAVGFVGTFAGGSLVARSVRGTTLLAALMLAAASAAVDGDRQRHGGRRHVVLAWGVAFGLMPVALTGWMMEALPDAPEAGQALLVTGFQVAIASGALIGGVTVDNFGISSAMVLSGVLVLIAALIVGTLGRARGGAPLAAIPE
jgi:predicted MFS family arabinose efflux permease